MAHHGFDDDPATRRLLRSPPDPAALAWASSEVGHSIDGWIVLRGGTSSAMYALDAGGTRFVLRCYVRRDVNASEPDLAIREAAALDVASQTDVPTPRLVAVDSGDAAGVPLLLMTWLAGEVVWEPREPEAWLRGMAELLPAIHEIDASATAALGQYRTYRQRSYAPPDWSTKPETWERAVALFHGPILDEERCFVHRDFHPGNVLWTDRRVTGLVDWQAACIGPPSVDIGHCRANLLRVAPPLAPRFTALAQRASGRPFHPWADIAAIVGWLDDLRSRPPDAAGRAAIEAALDSAVGALEHD